MARVYRWDTSQTINSWGRPSFLGTSHAIFGNNQGTLYVGSSDRDAIVLKIKHRAADIVGFSVITEPRDLDPNPQTSLGPHRRVSKGWCSNSPKLAGYLRRGAKLIGMNVHWGSGYARRGSAGHRQRIVEKYVKPTALVHSLKLQRQGTRHRSKT